jgi:siroheme synthase
MEVPSLRELLTTRDTAGEATGFLGTHAAFARVRDLERANRSSRWWAIFAGRKALAGIAAELRAYHLPVATFYVSTWNSTCSIPTAGRADRERPRACRPE